MRASRLPSTAVAFLLAASLSACSSSNGSAPVTDPVKSAAATVIDEGRQTFRFETFGDEAFWGDTLKLHQALEGSARGGVGGGVSPATALAVGLKVDSDALPASLIADLKAGRVNLNDPAVTLQLLDLSAVVGVKGFSNGAGGLQKVGITCALCHATVDDSVAPGIGKRLDGWPNRDLDVGTIVSLSPDLSVVASLFGITQDQVRTILKSWGPGKFDAALFLDGKVNATATASFPTLIPPAYGLRGVNLHTFTGWGSLTQWNAFVANLEMHGVGHYTDSRLDDAAKFPLAASNKMGHTSPPAGAADLITPKLGALEFYQLALDAPAPAAGSFDSAAAARGKTVFEGTAKCATCHVPPVYTDAGWNMHSSAEIGLADNLQASRSPDGKYRTTPLRGVSAHAKGGYYHDGRFATLGDVVAHYDTDLALGLTVGQRTDLVEYLKSL
jgi:cytochrome c5